MSIGLAHPGEATTTVGVWAKGAAVGARNSRFAFPSTFAKTNGAA